MEGLEICLFNHNSLFCFKQSKKRVTGAPNSCSYADFTIYLLDKSIFAEKEQEYEGFIILEGIYRVLWAGTYERLVGVCLSCWAT